ncbi:BadF/BadG/BcrA/BcrD ATPase family protein [Defluviimonas aestuarii]|uniref:BadF/BadG/BcrA/BcrD ATPase family protein n=1 Tax=Albidovulum aestuarii TaxID=1130726 RepID=UPI00249CE71F|nr:BadF/BadG/BcrA/BcrD ATPase family protein [Defluviimonas aestuarii]MDI3337311.1 BadF/BadG/BcrA/BcrD ATPase family protein [Defluviimonas aestuarii]
MKRHDSLTIGLDGGGTSSRAALIFGFEGRRVEAAGGPANVSDFGGAIARINDLLERLAETAGISFGEVAGATAHVGLAGVMDAAMAARVAAALPFKRVVVTDDQPTMIAGALGDQDGAVAAIGTGSFIGRQTAGVIRVLGGWGFLLGDQASGAWLGRQLLQETLMAGDGMAPHSPLTAAIYKRFGNGSGIVAFALSSSPVDFATLAPEIVTAAKSGDAVAVRLMREGATYIESALTTLGLTEGETICMTGGLGPAYADWLGPGLASRIRAAEGTALDGALLLAARLAEGGA